MEEVAAKVNISESTVLANEALFSLPSPSADATVYSQYKEMSSEIKTALAVYNGQVATIKRSVANLNSLANALDVKDELLNVVFKPYGIVFSPTIERKQK